MPNHVDTKLTVTGDKKQLKEFFENHFRTEMDNGTEIDIFDFDTIVPMPKSLDITSGSGTTNAIALIKAEKGDFTEIDRISQYPWVIEKKPASSTLGLREYTIKELEKNLDENTMKEGQMALDNIEKYGCATWYDWKCQYWGTKWGAYSVHMSTSAEDILEVYYNTAWSPATPIFHKLNEMYPKLVFVQTVMDEGMGFGGRQTWDENGYTEDLFDGDELYAFSNEEYGTDYKECKCGQWFDSEWCNEDDDATLCEECNYEIEEAKKKEKDGKDA